MMLNWYNKYSLRNSLKFIRFFMVLKHTISLLVFLLFSSNINIELQIIFTNKESFNLRPIKTNQKIYE